MRQLTTFFIMDILARDKDKPLLPLWIDYLSSLYSRSTPACHWFLRHYGYDQQSLQVRHCASF